MDLKIYFKVENPKGKRIEEFFISGIRLNRSKTYTACFMTEQGILVSYGTNRQDLDIKTIDALKSYLVKYNEITTGLRGTIAS